MGTICEAGLFGLGCLGSSSEADSRGISGAGWLLGQCVVNLKSEQIKGRR